MEHVADYDYDLPEELIAQHPPADRGTSRMMVVGRDTGACEMDVFASFPQYLHAGDCLVLNDTRVLQARLFGRKRSGSGKVEALLLEETAPGEWLALVRPGRRLKPGTVVAVDNADAAFEVVGREDEMFTLRFDTTDVEAVLAQAGAMPLPPYIRRPADGADAARYQTVFARDPGAVAAPTAGLHFTDEILTAVEQRGIEIVRLTLHVGLGTFQPVSAERVSDHVMHEERYVLTPDAAAEINRCRAAGGRVVAVGTTCVRTLETCAAADGSVAPGSGRTDLFMHPPYQPKAVDMLLTNFHLPRSTLLMLVSCFLPREQLFAAYRLAIKEGFRFYSYGDCMLVSSEC